ncbi:MAG: histidine phosphatase family protein [Pseudomonadota bacterium]
MAPRPGRRRIFLMRHGHVDYFAPGLKDPREAVLTEEGEAQARAAGEALSEIPFDIAVSSGLKRTRRTAELVLAANDAPPDLEDEPGLEELRSGRYYEALEKQELAARLAFCFDDADAPGAEFLPNGELFADAEARASDAIRRLCTERDWRVALVVAHEGINRLLLGWATGGGLSTVAAFEQDLACVNVLDVDITPDDDGGLQLERIILKSMNVTPYDMVKHGLPKTALEHLFDVDFGGVRPRA